MPQAIASDTKLAPRLAATKASVARTSFKHVISQFKPSTEPGPIQPKPQDQQPADAVQKPKPSDDAAQAKPADDAKPADNQTQSKKAKQSASTADNASSDAASPEQVADAAGPLVAMLELGDCVRFAPEAVADAQEQEPADELDSGDAVASQADPLALAMLASMQSASPLVSGAAASETSEASAAVIDPTALSSAATAAAMPEPASEAPPTESAATALTTSDGAFALPEAMTPASDTQLEPVIADAIEKTSKLPIADAAAKMDAAFASIPEPAGAAPQVASASPQPEVAHTRESQFHADNTDQIVQNVHSQLMPRGGTMHIRLDPPELGALQVTMKMVDGAMSATFITSNDEASRLVTHNLTNLKTSLEATGVSVERIAVKQASNDSSASSNDSRDQGNSQSAGQQQEQQRRDTLRRMWRRAAFGTDGFDLVA